MVLLAYKGKRPSSQFLVAWPASGEEGARDFVFSCKLVAKGKRLKVTNVVMCVEDELDQAGLHGAEADESNDALVKLLQRNIDDDDLSGKEYKAFHTTSSMRLTSGEYAAGEACGATHAISS